MRSIVIFIVSSFIGCIIALEMEEEFYPDERDALIQLRDMVESSSNLHANWTGRACNTENQSQWAGIGCSDWHVTHLVLEGIELTNSLPLPPLLFHNLTFLKKLSFANNSLHGPLPNLANLVYLQFVLLSTNQFSDSIPFSYIDLPNLVRLELQENDLSGQIPPFDQEPLVAFNVSNNQLTGLVPETRVLQRFSGSSFANNSGLCGDIQGFRPCPPPPPGVAPTPFQPSRKNDSGLQSWNIALIAAAAVLVPLCVILTRYMMRVWRKATRKQEVTDDPETSMQLEFMERQVFELDDLLRSAAEVMGRGNLGTTYKAVLECGSVVAVKRMRMEHPVIKKKDFAQQMQLLGNIKHENLAEMISFYNSKEEKLIVYEYVANGSLFSLLHEKRGMGRVVLDWKSRVRIIKEIAEGLEYLHLHLHHHQRVPHGNLKSSNVLIQRDDQSGSLRVKLTDYGLLGVAPAQKLAVGRTPEFLEGKKLTSKADVYCLGIVVLEMVTGRAPAPAPGEEELSGWVKEAVSIDWSTDIVDIEIVGEKEGYEDMLNLTEIALQCTDQLPERRPNITQILTNLHHIIPHPHPHHSH